ncbi:hypothetical protein VOLCADRAFT_108735 [Volvox carteri f. nagariensis]|uniref:Uncharacterized protein n=1 Tax=Volvox carteri f. nagariensis TaxID=3068 RepID=D8UM56_VOLCA|nr:uncharacterized protein VOLCADRAFT_108735 [Volvox carteri f. nagariensis]EFJ39193.1 hypothetical protein VOLCADRAFT_108735 [Volvox carteri f. nagariensis]|eukprot:XP_002959742.1 hypothetical protein VOLCADRAFT_108735 [Volvox carteri f. nagariensis]
MTPDYRQRMCTAVTEAGLDSAGLDEEDLELLWAAKYRTAARLRAATHAWENLIEVHLAPGVVDAIWQALGAAAGSAESTLLEALYKLVKEKLEKQNEKLEQHNENLVKQNERLVKQSKKLEKQSKKLEKQSKKLEKQNKKMIEAKALLERRASQEIVKYSASCRLNIKRLHV